MAVPVILPAPWTIIYEGQSKSIAAWGMCRPKLEILSQAQDKFSMEADGMSVDLPEVFAYGKRLQLLDPKGVKRFDGIVTETPAQGDGKGESQSYTASGPWWYLDNLPYQLLWKLWRLDSGVWSAVDQYTTQYILGLDYTGLNISTKQVVDDVIAYAIAQGVPLAAGTVLPDRPIAPTKLYPPPDEQRDLTCGEVIKKMLRWHPDAVTWFDYSEATPKLNVRVKEDLVAHKLLAPSLIGPFIQFGGQVVNLGFRITKVSARPRFDLVRDVVSIKYLSRGSRDGVETLDVATEVAPPTATGREIGALVLTIDLKGIMLNTLSAEVEAEPPDFSELDTWLARIPLLSDPRVDPASIVGPYVNVGVVPGFNRNGVLGLPRELINGQVADWMTEAGQPVIAEDEIFSAKFDFKLHETPGVFDDDPVKKPIQKLFTIRTKMTNARTGIYRGTASFEAGDPMPLGLATFLQKALSVLTYDGVIETGEAECSMDISVGNVVSVGQARPEWETMKAIVQRATFDLELSSSVLQFGPCPHLSAGDLVDLMKVGRMRFRWTNPASRSSGKPEGTQSLKLGQFVDGQDTNEGGELYQQFKVKDASPPTQTGPHHVFIDATAGTIRAASGAVGQQTKVDTDFKEGAVTITDESSHVDPTKQRKIELRVDECKSNTDAQPDTYTNRPIKIRELKLCVDADGTGEKKWRILIPCSEAYPLADGTNPPCGGGGNWFKGEYDNRLAYSQGDGVRASVGINAGTYIAVKAVPANPNQDADKMPWSGGGYWVLIGRLTDQSSWL